MTTCASSSWGLVDSSQAASEEPGAAASTARKLALTLRGGEQKLVAFQGQEITEIAAGGAANRGRQGSRPAASGGGLFTTG